MPELPEVETIRLGLQKYLVGKRIEGVEVRLRRIFSGDEKNSFRRPRNLLLPLMSEIVLAK